jgi:hypothetical protein
VGLVDDDLGGAGGAEGAEEGVLAQAFRCGVDEFVGTVGEGVEDAALLLRREAAVDERGALSDRRRQGFDLVFHQGDKRGDDERRSLQEHGRQLEGEGFAGAGRHRHQRIAAGENVGDHRRLPGPQCLVAEVPAQDLQGAGIDGHVGLGRGGQGLVVRRRRELDRVRRWSRYGGG